MKKFFAMMLCGTLTAGILAGCGGASGEEKKEAKMEN